MNDEIEQLQADNIATFMAQGPGLRASYSTWVVARDRTRGRVMLGGLGGMGVGQMWSVASDRHESLPGWDDAPDRDSWMEFGTPEACEQLDADFAEALAWTKANPEKAAERFRLPGPYPA